MKRYSLLLLLLVSLLCNVHAKPSESLMEDYEIGIVRSYVNALDSFATVMPFIGGDTESDWAADSVHVMARKILDGNLDFNESMCRIYQIQDYLAYGMSYPLAVLALRNDTVIARYALGLPAEDDTIFAAISAGGFKDLHAIRERGLISLFNIQLYYRFHNNYMETFDKGPIYTTVELGQCAMYLNILGQLGDRTEHDIQKISAALEGALFFNTFNPLVLTSSPSRESALQIYDFMIEAADFFDAYADPLYQEDPQPMSDSEYKVFLTKATDYKAALLRLITQGISTKMQAPDSSRQK